MEITKDQLINKLIEQYIQVIEYANQHYEVSLLEAKCGVLHKSISFCFPDIFSFMELSLCTIFECNSETFFNNLKIVKIDWRSRSNKRNIEPLLRTPWHDMQAIAHAHAVTRTNQEKGSLGR